VTWGIGTDANPRDGDRVTFTVEVLDGRVRVRQTTLDACPAARRAAESLVRLVNGGTPEAAARIQVRELIDRLRLDADAERCALTALTALRAALVDVHVRLLA